MSRSRIDWILEVVGGRWWRVCGGSAGWRWWVVEEGGGAAAGLHLSPCGCLRCCCSLKGGEIARVI